MRRSAMFDTAAAPLLTGALPLRRLVCKHCTVVEYAYSRGTCLRYHAAGGLGGGGGELGLGGGLGLSGEELGGGDALQTYGGG